MKNNYLFLLLTLFLGASLGAQTIAVPPNLDQPNDSPFDYTFVDVFIEADTNAMGEQLNDTYLLESGGLYYFTGTRRWDFDVTLRATGDPANGRPTVDRFNPTGGTSLPAMYRGTGNFTWDGLYIVLGEEGPTAATYETASFRPEGDGKRYVFNNCVVEKSRQGTIRSEGEDVKIYVTNCHLYNFGDFERFQGNGRVVDIRDNFGDSVVIRNNVIHNTLDRMFIGFRQQGLNYFEFTHNTVFNHVGRHGFIQLKNTKETVIQNNFIMNPSTMGSSPSLANEQINQNGVANYLISIDTLVDGASVTVSNNNIFWTDDVIDHYNTSDSVVQPPILSPEIVAALGDEAGNAFFTEVLELNNVPSRDPIIQYSREAVEFQDSVGITDIMVEDIAFQGTDWDKGYLFDFSMFDPCYSENSMSATASTEGDAVGAVDMCANLISSVQETVYNRLLALKASPNPSAGEVTFSYELPQTSDVTLSIVSFDGRLITKITNSDQPAGAHQFTWNGFENLPTGMYIAHLQSDYGRMYVKLVHQ